MTREEAIEILWQYDVNFEPHPAEEVMHAIDMAIEALKAPTDTPTDLISRADAIKAWDKLSKRGRTEFDQVLMTLPSADAVSREEYDDVKAYMETLVDAFIEDGEELADSVKVVRCKDCKHHHECCRGTIPLNPDGYCSDGSRKERNNE